jgi:uncharacterized protein YqjF (DUF2071 family)
MARPEQRPVGRQRWRDLLFLHWPVPPGSLRRLVPAGLELDLYAGQAWITVIPFLIAESRPAGWPSAFASRLLETNLRTYVRGPDGEPGIYFWSLDASSLLAVLGARLFYGLPYFPAAMSMRADGARVDYASRRRLRGSAQLIVAWRVGEPIGFAAPDTRDHFLIERYALYVARWGRVYRARVRHPPYPLHRAHVDALTESLLSAAGLPKPAEPPLCHYSPGVDVDVFWPRQVPPRPT